MASAIRDFATGALLIISKQISIRASTSYVNTRIINPGHSLFANKF